MKLIMQRLISFSQRQVSRNRSMSEQKKKPMVASFQLDTDPGWPAGPPWAFPHKAVEYLLIGCHSLRVRCLHIQDRVQASAKHALRAPRPAGFAQLQIGFQVRQGIHHKPLYFEEHTPGMGPDIIRMPLFTQGCISYTLDLVRYTGMHLSFPISNDPELFLLRVVLLFI